MFCRTALPVFLVCMVFVLGSAQHMVGDKTDGQKGTYEGGKSNLTVVVVCLAIVTVGQLSSIADLLLKTHQAEMLRHYLWVGLGVCSVQGWFFLVDSFEGILIKMADIQQWSASHSIPRMKQKAIMMSFTHFQSPAEDRVYSFAEHVSPGKAVADLVSVYMLLAKIYAAIAFVCVYLKIEAGMYVYVLVILTSAIITKHLSPAIDNLLQISQTKPFYLGDIIALAPTGDGASYKYTGMVEAITWSHIVLRTFEAKQQWISHSEFLTMSISNWQRRTTKPVLLEFMLKYDSEPAKVQALADYGREYIGIGNWKKTGIPIIDRDLAKGEDPLIKVTGYRTCKVTHAKMGYNLKMVFFPLSKKRKDFAREKVLFAIAAEARRLGVVIVPREGFVLEAGGGG